MAKLKSILKRMFGSIIFIIFSVWILLSLIMFAFQPNFIYYPHKKHVSTPRDISLQYQDITLETRDGEQLNAWWIPSVIPRATLLFLHGNAGNISHRLDSIKIFNQLDLSILIIDYRGYGKSTGEPSEKGTYIDADTAWRYLTEERKIDPSNIIVFGRSLGGGIASYVAEKYSPAGVIIESSFTSITDMGRHFYPYLPVGLIARIKYPSIDRMKNITSPTMIIHSPSDEIVPYRFGKKLFEQANQPKTFLEISGGHNDGFVSSGQKYIDGLFKFIKTITQ